MSIASLVVCPLLNIILTRLQKRLSLLCKYHAHPCLSLVKAFAGLRSPITNSYSCKSVYNDLGFFLSFAFGLCGSLSPVNLPLLKKELNKLLVMLLLLLLLLLVRELEMLI